MGANDDDTEPLMVQDSSTSAQPVEAKMASAAHGTLSDASQPPTEPQLPAAPRPPTGSEPDGPSAPASPPAELVLESKPTLAAVPVPPVASVKGPHVSAPLAPPAPSAATASEPVADANGAEENADAASLPFTGEMNDLIRQAMLQVSNSDYALYWQYKPEHGQFLNIGHYAIDGSLMSSCKGLIGKVVILLDRVRTSGLPRFVKYIGDISPDDCALVPVRLSAGVRSLILLPHGDSCIIEIGSRATWDTPPDVEDVLEFSRSDVLTSRPPFSPIDANMRKVMANTLSDYCIFWEYSPRDNILRLGRHMAKDGGQLMARSSETTFAPGHACVGSAWVDPTYRLVRDSTNLDIRTFLRADIIKEEGVKSIGFTKFPNGVVEVGSLTTWVDAPSIDVDPRCKRCYDFLTEKKKDGGLPSAKITDDFLYEALLQTNGAEYALFWAFNPATQHYVNTGYFGVDDHIMADAKGLTATVAGLLDRARTSGLARFVKNIKDIKVTDCGLVPIRVANGVSSLLLIPYEEGLLEVGTRRLWDDPPAFAGVTEFTRSDKVIMRPPFDPTKANLIKVMKHTAADYCIFWEMMPKENLLKMVAHHSYDEGLMARSVETTFPPGHACVGSAWTDPTYRLVRDSTKLDIRTFLRADIIKEDGIKSIGFTKFPNGVVEYGSIDGWTDAPNLDTDPLGRKRINFLIALSRPVFVPSVEHMIKVIRYTRSVYAIFWEFIADINELRCAVYHEIEGRNVMEMSRTFTFTPGMACIGSAWVDPTYTLVKDATKLDIKVFLRANLILNDGVKQIGFTRFPNGVLEFGTTEWWTEMQTIDTDEYGRRVNDFLE